MGTFKESSYSILVNTEIARAELTEFADNTNGKRKILISIMNTFIRYCELLVEFCYIPFWYNNMYTYMEVASYTPIYLFEQLIINEKNNGSMEQKFIVEFLKRNLEIDLRVAEVNLDSIYFLNYRVKARQGRFWEMLRISIIRNERHTEMIQELFTMYIFLVEEFLQLGDINYDKNVFKKNQLFLKKYIFGIL